MRWKRSHAKKPKPPAAARRFRLRARGASAMQRWGLALVEAAGLLLIAISVGKLAGGWWGGLVGGVLAVLYANAAFDEGQPRPPREEVPQWQ